MTGISSSRKKQAHFKAVAGWALIGLTLLPLSVIAKTVSPLQIIPPAKGATCAPITASDIRPYIYNNKLDSFDVTISDFRYVAVSASVGETLIPLNHMSRWLEGGAGIRTHFDLQSTSVKQNLSVQVTFLSVQQNAAGASITCLYSVSAAVNTSGVTVSGTGSAQYPTGTPDNSSGSPKNTSNMPTSSTDTDANSSTSPSFQNAGLVGATSALGALCVHGGGAKLWFVLLVLYVAFVVLLSMQSPEAGSAVKEWNIILILGVFLGLLIFWYMSAMCRAGFWTPILATLIAVGGLLYTAFQTSEPHEMLLLKDGKEEVKK